MGFPKTGMNMNAAERYRYERKFLVEALQCQQVIALIKLHPALFIETYPPRYVNNIYLDTADMDYYNENICGVQERRKVRIRWYGALFGPVNKAVLEYKIKNGLVGTKQSQPLQPFVFDESYHQGRFLDGAVKGLADETRYYLRDLDAVLLNRYLRYYFATTDGCFRVTVDSGLCFYNLQRKQNTFRNRQVNYQNRIVELKYDRQHDPQADRIAGYFPFPVTKNSKYVEGIDRVYL